MKPHRHSVFLTLGAIAGLALLATSGCAVWRIKQAGELARLSEPFEVLPQQSVATLLVLGDSTAVGTGASSPTQSVAGLIAKDHPQLQIVNRAQDGAKFADIVQQLEALGEQRFDAILVLGGGNNVIRLTRQKPLAQDVSLGRKHVLVPEGQMGLRVLLECRGAACRIRRQGPRRRVGAVRADGAVLS